jgi:hypothetical protein
MPYHRPETPTNHGTGRLTSGFECLPALFERTWRMRRICRHMYGWRSRTNRRLGGRKVMLERDLAILGNLFGRQSALCPEFRLQAGCKRGFCSSRGVAFIHAAGQARTVSAKACGAGAESDPEIVKVYVPVIKPVYMRTARLLTP